MECDALDGFLERCRQLAVLAGVCPLLSRQGRKAELAIQRNPTLCCAKRNVGRRRDGLQREAILQMGLKEAESIKGERSSLFRQLCQMVHT